ncbi:MAG: Holliday junction resolvase RuvX [Clostridia bacterium]|nr:Holliday junction resolvase RuvX [Clostridia bacterium]
MGRILCLDVGDVRIGLAMSDIMKIIANPLETLKRKNSQADFDYILNICKQNDVELIISGLPLSMNGQENVQTQKIREFIEVLQSQTNIPIKFVDERLTTVSAQRVLIESGMRRENRKNVVDKVAAAIILQGYLDRF